MAFRTICLVALAVSSVAPFAHGAPYSTAASTKPGMSVAPPHSSLSAYRRYVRIQADTLVGMTRVLAEEIKAGDLDAARSEYAPAHSYLERLKPIAAMFHDLDRRMDARADDFERKEIDPRFSGFHRLERGLFAKRSTVGLSGDAERLYADAQELRERVLSADLTPGILAEAATKLARDIADKKLGGAEERDSKTDLWDLEANIESVQQIVAVLQPQAEPQNAEILARTAVHFARINELLETNKDGCGFRPFDEVSSNDKAALKAAVAALAERLSTLRGMLAMD